MMIVRSFLFIKPMTLFFHFSSHTYFMKMRNFILRQYFCFALLSESCTGLWLNQRLFIYGMYTKKNLSGSAISDNAANRMAFGFTLFMKLGFEIYICTFKYISYDKVQIEYRGYTWISWLEDTQLSWPDNDVILNKFPTRLHLATFIKNEKANKIS